MKSNIVKLDQSQCPADHSACANVFKSVLRLLEKLEPEKTEPAAIPFTLTRTEFERQSKETMGFRLEPALIEYIGQRARLAGIGRSTLIRQCLIRFFETEEEIEGRRRSEMEEVKDSIRNLIECIS